MKILIIEDEQKLADALGRGLTQKGFATDILYDGTSALDRIMYYSSDYDLILLDLMLPGILGTEICTKVRAHGVITPIIILTSQDETEKKVELLLSGADDYMVKPFSFAELVARIHAILRRPTTLSPTDLSVGNIHLDPTARTATISGKPLILTLKEFSILEYFLRHPSEVVKREELLSHLWDFNYDAFSNVVDVHVKNLRKKLLQKGGRDVLETVRGVGYRLSL